MTCPRPQWVSRGRFREQGLVLKLCTLPWVISCKVTLENSDFSLFHSIFLVLLGAGTSFQSLENKFRCTLKIPGQSHIWWFPERHHSQTCFFGCCWSWQNSSRKKKPSACSCAAGANVTLLATLQFQTALKVSWKTSLFLKNWCSCQSWIAVRDWKGRAPWGLMPPSKYPQRLEFYLSFPFFFP